MRFSAATTAERLLPERFALKMRPLFDRFDALISDPGIRGQARRISVIAFAIRVMSAAIAFLSQVLLARWMGSFEYGIFVLVWTAMIIIGNLSCFGFHTSVIRFIPEFRQKNMIAELRGVLIASRLFVLLASTTVAALGILCVKMLSGVIESYYVVPFVLGFTCMPMVAMSDLLQGISRAHAKALTALAPTYIVRPLLVLIAMNIALLLGYSPSADTAILSAVLATYATTIIQLLGVTASFDGKLPPGPRVVALRHWIMVSLPIFLVESFFFILTNADVLMVGRFMQPDDVAVYFATVKIVALVHFVYFAVKAGAAQRYAHFTHSDRAALAGFARETVGWTFWPSVFMGLIVLTLGRPILTLFGSDFATGYPLLFVLVAGVVARSAVGPCESLLTMSGNQNVCAAVYALTLAFNISMSVLLIPHLGLWGAALATGLSLAFEAAALSFTAWRRLGIVMVVFMPVARIRTA